MYFRTFVLHYLLLWDTCQVIFSTNFFLVLSGFLLLDIDRNIFQPNVVRRRTRARPLRDAQPRGRADLDHLADLEWASAPRRASKFPSSFRNQSGTVLIFCLVHITSHCTRTKIRVALKFTASYF